MATERTVTCKVCGKKFITADPNSRYCSYICKAAGDKIRRKKWQTINPGYNTEYMRKYRATKRKLADNEKQGTEAAEGL